MVRYLAALVPVLLGTLVAGCGGILGSVEGTGPTTPGAQPARFSLAGTAFVENPVGTRQAANDFVLGGATVRVLRITGRGANATVEVVATGTTNAAGQFSFSIEIPAAQAQLALQQLWLVEVFATGTNINGTTGNVYLAGAFVPSNGGSLTRNCNVTSTIVADNLIASLAANGVAGLSFSDITATENAASTTVRGTVSLADIRTTATTPDAARQAKLVELANRVAAVYNALVASVQLSIGNTVVATSTTPGSITRAQGVTDTWTGVGLTSAGAPLAVGIEFVKESETSTNVVTLTQIDANSATTKTNAAGTAVIVGRIAVPGTTQAERKLARCTINVTHQQAHAQGGAVGN